MSDGIQISNGRTNQKVFWLCFVKCPVPLLLDKNVSSLAETENYFHTRWYCDRMISVKTSCTTVSHDVLNTGLRPKQIYLTWMVERLVELLRVACCECWWYLVSQLMSEAVYDTCNNTIVTNIEFMINVWLGEGIPEASGIYNFWIFHLDLPGRWNITSVHILLGSLVASSGRKWWISA